MTNVIANAMERKKAINCNGKRAMGRRFTVTERL